MECSTQSHFAQRCMEITTESRLFVQVLILTPQVVLSRQQFAWRDKCCLPSRKWGRAALAPSCMIFHQGCYFDSSLDASSAGACDDANRPHKLRHLCLLIVHEASNQPSLSAFRLAGSELIDHHSKSRSNTGQYDCTFAHQPTAAVSFNTSGGCTQLPTCQAQPLLPDSDTRLSTLTTP
jgi:hypothetical protein